VETQENLKGKTTLSGKTLLWVLFIKNKFFIFTSCEPHSPAVRNEAGFLFSAFLILRA
jgi:hypothetical protein